MFSKLAPDQVWEHSRHPLTWASWNASSFKSIYETFWGCPLSNFELQRLPFTGSWRHHLHKKRKPGVKFPDKISLGVKPFAEHLWFFFQQSPYKALWMCLVSYLKLTNQCLLWGYKYNIFVHLDVNYQVPTPTVVWCLCIEMHAKQDAIMSDKMHFDKYHVFLWPLWSTVTWMSPWSRPWLAPIVA